MCNELRNLEVKLVVGRMGRRRKPRANARLEAVRVLDDTGYDFGFEDNRAGIERAIRGQMRSAARGEGTGGKRPHDDPASYGGVANMMRSTGGRPQRQYRYGRRYGL